MITEHKQMKYYWGCGYVTLNKLAKPDTVVVMFLKERWYPVCFGIFGNPFFSEEQVKKYDDYVFEEAMKGNKVKGILTVSYEKDDFSVSRDCFDSVLGLQKSVNSMDTLVQVLKQRSRCLKANKKMLLNEFVLFGRFYLDEKAGIYFIQKASENSEDSYNTDVETFVEFLNQHKNVKRKFIVGDLFSGYAICPLCGEEITLEDVKHNLFVRYMAEESCYLNNHKTCYLENQRQKNVKN